MGNLVTFVSQLFDDSSSRDTLVIGNRSFSVELRISQTASCATFILEETATQRRYAVKTAKKARMTTDDALYQQFLLEKDTLQRVHHPCVANLLCADQDPYRLFLVSELSLGGDLSSKLLHHKRLPERAVRFVALGALLALQHLHALGVTHADVKPPNLLLSTDGYLLLCDFGLASHAAQPPLERRHWGTSAYMAPEVLLDGALSPAADVWSLGVTLFECFWGLRPWDVPGLYAPPAEDPVAASPSASYLLGPPVTASSSADSSTSLSASFAQDSPVPAAASPQRAAEERQQKPLSERARSQKLLRQQVRMVDRLRSPDPENDAIPFRWGAHDVNWSEGLARLVAAMTAASPAQRPTATELLASEYFSGIDVQAYLERKLAMSSFLRLREEEYPFSIQFNIETEPRINPAVDAISLTDQHRFFDAWNWARAMPAGSPDQFVSNDVAALHQSPLFLSQDLELVTTQHREGIDDHPPHPVPSSSSNSNPNPNPVSE